MAITCGTTLDNIVSYCYGNESPYLQIPLQLPHLFLHVLILLDTNHQSDTTAK